MKPRAFLPVVVAFGLLASPGLAQPRTASQPGPATPDVLPTAGGPAGPGGTGGTGGADAPAADPKKPVGQMGGYAYSDKPSAAAASRPRSAYRKTGPAVNMPGFEPTPDGGSRFFVQLSQTVPVEERKAQGSITYILKGASPRVWNNTNALVTVHFNTPVSRARLVPQGADLLFVVEMRAAATPTYKMSEGADKSAILSIDFPKGDYLAAGAEPAMPTGDVAAPAAARPARATPAKPRTGGRRAPARPNNPAPTTDPSKLTR